MGHSLKKPEKQLPLGVLYLHWAAALSTDALLAAACLPVRIHIGVKVALGGEEGSLRIWQAIGPGQTDNRIGNSCNNRHMEMWGEWVIG